MRNAVQITMVQRQDDIIEGIAGLVTALPTVHDYNIRHPYEKVPSFEQVKTMFPARERDDSDYPMLWRPSEEWGVNAEVFRRHSPYGHSVMMGIGIHCSFERHGDHYAMAVTVSGFSNTVSNFVWLDERYAALYREANEGHANGDQEIDVRHLSNEEVEALAVLLGRYRMNTDKDFVTPYFRCTLVQLQYLFQRQMLPNVPENRYGKSERQKSYPLVLQYPTHTGKKFNIPVKGSLADAFRKHYFPDVVKKSKRIAGIFDTLGFAAAFQPRNGLPNY